MTGKGARTIAKRYLLIIETLKRREIVNAAHLAEIAGVSVNTIKRDMGELVLDYPIRSVYKGYTLIRK